MCRVTKRYRYYPTDSYDTDTLGVGSYLEKCQRSVREVSVGYDTLTKLLPKCQ